MWSLLCGKVFKAVYNFNIYLTYELYKSDSILHYLFRNCLLRIVEPVKGKKRHNYFGEIFYKKPLPISVAAKSID